MNISVVIVNYKTPKLLMQCLQSLQQEAPEVRDIIVIDNSSGDNSLALLKKEYPWVRRIASPVNAGFGRGVNWGITNARNPYILILNPDVIAQPGSLQKLYEEMQQNPNIGLIAPQLRYLDGSLQYSCCRFQTPMLVVYRRSWLGKTSHGKKRLDHFLMKDFDHTKPRNVDWVIGGCMLVRRQALEQVGLIDERFFMYFEDMDWCRRFWQSGWLVRYEPRAVMIHHHRRQSASRPGLRGLLNPLGRIHLSSGFKYFYKHIGNSGKLAKTGKLRST